MSVTVSAINIFPIKGCRGYSLEAADVSTQGISGDRVFTVLLDGHRTNQKKIPQLRELSAIWQGSDLRLAYPGQEEFILDANETNGARLTESFRTKELPIGDMGEEVAGWLSAALGSSVRLAKLAEPVPWFFPLPEFSLVHEQPQDRFVDAAPVLLANMNSLADLNARLETPITMDRFRANLVVEGLDPYQEDELPVFRFPELELQRVAVCERCTITTVDTETGVMGKEPLNTLSKYRKRKDDYAGGIMFGIYLTGGKGRVSVGDELGV